MKATFTTIYNPFHHEYQVWMTVGMNSEIVKRFKSKTSAEKWAAAHNK